MKEGKIHKSVPSVLTKNTLGVGTFPSIPLSEIRDLHSSDSILPVEFQGWRTPLSVPVDMRGLCPVVDMRGLCAETGTPVVDMRGLCPETGTPVVDMRGLCPETGTPAVDMRGLCPETGTPAVAMRGLCPVADMRGPETGLSSIENNLLSPSEEASFFILSSTLYFFLKNHLITARQMINTPTPNKLRSTMDTFAPLGILQTHNASLLSLVSHRQILKKLLGQVTSG